MTDRTQMTERATEIRGEMLARSAAQFGSTVVEAWADDDVKVRALNTIAQMKADEETAHPWREQEGA